MGLIKAGIGSLGGVLADQWKEYFYCEAIPAELMGITFDTYWAQFAGADPAKVLLDLKGRVECIHLKDMCATERNGNRMAPVGHGNMDFERILVSAEKAGSQYLLVEQDDCYGEDPFACMKKSFAYLQSLGLAF